MPAPAPAPAPAKAGAKWYDQMKFMAFVDGYYSALWTDIKNTSIGAVRAFDNNNGFSLSMFGSDLSWELGMVGATVSLRFGPTAVTLAGGPTSTERAVDLHNLTQAYITLKASDKLSVDIGKFNTIYGAEVAESWQDPTYTRGAVYFFLQPFYHAGLRVNYQLNDAFGIKFMVVNGYQSAETNAMKTFGIQFNYGAGPLAVALGYLVGPEQTNDNEDFRHLIDLVVTLAANDKLNFALNGDFVMEKVGGETVKAYGVMLSGHMQFTNIWGVGLRGEFLGDPDGYLGFVGAPKDNLITASLSIDAALGKYALLRLETRMDALTDGKFPKFDGDPSSIQLTSTLGVVFKTE
jgi:hypothetical protein